VTRISNKKILNRYHAPSAAQYVVAASRAQCAHGVERIASRRVVPMNVPTNGPIAVRRKRSIISSIDTRRLIDKMIDRLVLIGNYVCMSI